MAEPEYGVAASHLGEKSGAKPKGVSRPMKEFHAKELHDGSYHHTKHHGRDHMGMEVHPPEEGSSPDLDGVHDHMEEHFGGEHGGGEKHGEKKQGREEKASTKSVKPTSEKDEKTADEEMDEK